MVEEPAGEPSGGARDGLLAAASGLLTVAVAVAPGYPVLASVPLGIPAGFNLLWAATREAAARTVAWPLADGGGGGGGGGGADYPDPVAEEDCPPGTGGRDGRSAQSAACRPSST